MSRRRIGTLPNWQRGATHITLTLCAFSGLAYFMKHDLGWLGAQAGAHSLLALHGITAALAVMAFGAVIPAHIRISWMAKRNRASGIAMCVFMGVLIGSGWALYYGSEEIRDGAVFTHLALGIGALALFPLHLIIGRRS